MLSLFKSDQNGIRKEAGITLKLGLPVIIAQLLQMSMNFVDTVMAGNLSPQALAAVAVGGAVFMPLVMLVAGTLMAVNPVVSQLKGARTLELIGVKARQGLWLSLLLAVPLFFLIRNLKIVMLWMEVTPSIIPTALEYMNAFSWGVFPLSMYMALRFFNEGLSVTRPGMYMALLGVLVNIPANYILMYGKLGFPAMGAAGCGYASALSMLAMFLGMLLFTIKYKPYKRFSIFSTIRAPEWIHLKELLTIGIPIGISSTMEVTMFAVVGLLIASLGTIAVAGHQIALNFAAFTFMIPFGISTAITTRVADAAGRQNLTEMRKRGFVGVALCVGVMSCTAILMLTLPELITGIYTDNEAVQQMAVNLLFMAAIFQISDGLQVGGFGALRGLKDTKIPMFVNLIAYWLIGLPLCYYLGFTLQIGPRGLWIGLIAGLSVAAILHNVRFWWKTKS